MVRKGLQFLARSRISRATLWNRGLTCLASRNCSINDHNLQQYDICGTARICRLTSCQDFKDCQRGERLAWPLIPTVIQILQQ